MDPQNLLYNLKDLALNLNWKYQTNNLAQFATVCAFLWAISTQIGGRLLEHIYQNIEQLRERAPTAPNQHEINAFYIGVTYFFTINRHRNFLQTCTPMVINTSWLATSIFCNL